MTRPQHSIDGFIPRRSGSALGERHPASQQSTPIQGGLRPRAMAQNATAASGLQRSSLGLSRTDIDESLKSIDTGDGTKANKRRFRGIPKSKARRIVKWVIILFVVAALAIAGWVAYRAINASGNIFKGNIFGIVQSKPLKQDANGRSNILMLGTSEDDPGHEAGQLTDSMMIVSIDQKGKNVSMISVPRDLYVKYGEACSSGYAGKINVYFSCSNTGTSDSDEQDRLAKTQKFIGDIFGVDIQYGVHVNNTVIKEAVDAVGGVDVDIQGNGPVPNGVKPGSILDRNFDWRCGYKCNLVKYDPGVHHIDGEHALFLAMARGDAVPTYGLVDSNFDREKNQQKIIVALKQKAVTTGTLTDVSKVTKLLDTLGKNLRTNFETSEIRTLMDLGKSIKPEDMKTVSLFGGDAAVVTTGSYGGASVVMPSAGIFDYSGIQSFIKQNLSTNPVTRENAKVEVLNGSSTPGTAQIEADKLKNDGFVIGLVANAPTGNYDAAEVYQIGDGNSATKAKLESLYGVKVKTATPPIAVTGDTKFIVIIGQASSKN